MNEGAYEQRAFAMAVAEEVETLGRACDAKTIIVELPTGERVRSTRFGTWVHFRDQPAYALGWHRRDRAERERVS